MRHRVLHKSPKTNLPRAAQLAFGLAAICFSVSSAPAQDSASDVSKALQASQNPAPEDTLQLWQICNQTSFVLRIATASDREDKLYSSGWDKIISGQCLDKHIPKVSPRYLYAESSPAHWGGIREWKGAVELCAAPDDFEADNSIGCALQDMGTRSFAAIDPADGVTTLVEAADYGSRAQIAGIQRLLGDNGYEVARVDGISGRRTLRTLARYLKDNNLPTDLPPSQQLIKLEQTAQGKIKTVGLTLCNDSAAPIWAATGMRHKGGWISKGWWNITPEACVQVYTNTLKDAELHYYAQQENLSETKEGEYAPDKQLRSSGPSPHHFCISDSRFSAQGRENCSENGYKAANFRAVISDKPGQTIRLTDSDFTQANASGLRR